MVFAIISRRLNGFTQKKYICGDLQNQREAFYSPAD